MPVQFSKPGFYLTRSGAKAEILAVRDQQVFGLIYYPNDIRIACSWHLDGSMFAGALLPSDIVGPWREAALEKQAVLEAI